MATILLQFNSCKVVLTFLHHYSLIKTNWAINHVGICNNEALPCRPGSLLWKLLDQIAHLLPLPVSKCNVVQKPQAADDLMVDHSHLILPTQPTPSIALVLNCLNIGPHSSLPRCHLQCTEGPLQPYNQSTKTNN